LGFECKKIKIGMKELGVNIVHNFNNKSHSLCNNCCPSIPQSKIAGWFSWQNLVFLCKEAFTQPEQFLYFRLI